MRHWSLPDDHNDAIKDIIGILYVAKGPIYQHLQQHLEREEAGEHDVTDLQSIGQLIGLQEDRRGCLVLNSTTTVLQKYLFEKMSSQSVHLSVSLHSLFVSAPKISFKIAVSNCHL